jgi:hypothetical protein
MRTVKNLMIDLTFLHLEVSQVKPSVNYTISTAIARKSCLTKQRKLAEINSNSKHHWSNDSRNPIYWYHSTPFVETCCSEFSLLKFDQVRFILGKFPFLEKAARVKSERLLKTVDNTGSIAR